MAEECSICGVDKIPYDIDPDVVEYYCPKHDKIPSGADVSGLYCLLKLITRKNTRK